MDDPFADLEPVASLTGPDGVRFCFDHSEDVPPPRPHPPAPEPAIPPEIEVTEDGVARAFTETYGGTLRFDHDAGRWYHWEGDRWQADTTARAFEYCRRLARIASEGAKRSLLATARKASFAGGVERLARADPAHAVTQEIWDRDPWLLGCPGETVDLRTGRSAPPRPDDGITRRVAVAPAQHESCPIWSQFLEDATGADSSVMRFLQQWAGYSLTGITREHTLVFLYGDGGNGKSVFINTLTGLLGEYAATAGMETFTASKSDRHPTDLAMLAGARLVTASETEEGRAWAESRIKQMTGGDRITARFMRRDFFTYTPQFKLTLVGNHRPALANVNAAMRRRFCMVPFDRKPPEADPQLEDKLKAEWPGILRWAINGALDWQENGLIRPQKVLDATAEYFEEQDLFGQWLAEECSLDAKRGPYSYETSRDLFESWTAYARAAGEEPGTSTRFGEMLARRGLLRGQERVNGKVAKVWRGINLRRTTYAET
ncbi:phage/plasmid primase, P4 family [Cereibacter azotoformans]|uniref:phage/plasmid primase, P4 family n=1 Tax=Cereibacter azotoformans TaxID=43057 RepID=UPI001EEB2E38|nr:phage/plasmid primase, P4 family [Cereibacter azotoformans]ULB09571.1 phage/plasmid primase, P4 family [Cereibacter azotoformans]